MSTLRRSIRQASRAPSASPQPPPSVRSTRGGSRRGKNQTEVVQRSTHTYGSTGLETAAQHLAARQAMMQAVDNISGVVEKAGPSEDLSAVQEDDDEEESDVSGSRNKRSVTELTGTKTYHREGPSTPFYRSQDRRTGAEPYQHVESRATSAEPLSHVESRAASPDSMRASPEIARPATVTKKAEVIFWTLLFLAVLLGSAGSGYMFLRWGPAARDLRPIWKDIKGLKDLSWTTSDQIEGLKSQLSAVRYQVDNPGTIRRPERRINWLSEALGAVPDPFLTSPVAMGPVPVAKSLGLYGWWTNQWAMSTKMVSLGGNPNMALRPWVEPRRCFCAPSDRGKLQLVVLLPRSVTPTTFVIEHYPREELPTSMSGAAPKEFELWTSISDDVLRDLIARNIIKHFPDIFIKISTQPNRFLSPKQSLNYTWVPVGRWIYDVYAYENVQEFKIPVDLERFGVVISQVAIRVNSNWGNVDRTCLARVQMYGRDMSGTEEYLETRDRRDEFGTLNHYAINTDPDW